LSVPDRPDLPSFRVLTGYRESETDVFVEFMGTAVMPELGETMAVFRFVERPDRYLIATYGGFRDGQRFQSLVDEIDDDWSDG
jgi:hypothetical protein